MVPQAYKFVNTYTYKISVWKILSIILHARAHHIGGMNGDIQYDLSTLAFKNREQLGDFHSRIIRLQHEIVLSGETVSPTRLLFQYMKAFSNSNKLKSFIAPNMIYLITFLDNNGNSAVYTGVNVHGLYLYIEIIGSPTTSLSLVP